MHSEQLAIIVIRIYIYQMNNLLSNLLERHSFERTW